MLNAPENAVEMGVSKKENRTDGTIVARESLRRKTITLKTPDSEMAAMNNSFWRWYEYIGDDDSKTDNGQDSCRTDYGITTVMNNKNNNEFLYSLIYRLIYHI